MRIRCSGRPTLSLGTAAGSRTGTWRKESPEDHHRAGQNRRTIAPSKEDAQRVSLPLIATECLMESCRSLRPITIARAWAHDASRRRLSASALLAALGALAAISLAPLRGEAGSFSGNWWFDVCAKDYALCTGYMAAVMDLYQFTDKPNYCPPTGPGGARIDHVQAIVLKYLQEHPDKRHLPFARLTLDALERAYPCRKNSN